MEYGDTMLLLQDTYVEIWAKGPQINMLGFQIF